MPGPPARGPCVVTLGLDVELPLKPLDLRGQSPLLGSVRSTQNQGRSGYDGLPRVRVGSALATAFRGLLRVHACCGPQVCWPSLGGLLSGWLDDPGYPEAVHP